MKHFVRKHYEPVRHKGKPEPEPTGPFTAERLAWWREAMQNAGFNDRIDEINLFGHDPNIGEWEMSTWDAISILAWKVSKPTLTPSGKWDDEWHFAVAPIPPEVSNGYWDPPDQEPPNWDAYPELETWGDVVLAYLKLMVEMEYERLCEWAHEREMMRLEEKYEDYLAEMDKEPLYKQPGESDRPEHDYDPMYFELQQRRTLRRIGP